MGIETAIALAGLGMSAYQGIKGAQAEAAANSAADQAANEAKRISEADKFQSLQVPTLGTELAQQNIQARQSEQLQGLRDIGAAGVLGGLTGLEQQSRAQDLQLAGQVGDMQYQRDAALAQNAQQIEQGRMQREFAMNQAKLAGAQSAAAEGRQNQAAGIQGGLNALSSAATLSAYRDVNGVGGGTGNGSNFLGDVGYALGLGGTNATPVSQVSFAAQEAFKPTIQGMAPSSDQSMVKNVGAVTARGNMLEQQQLDGLRGPQAQFNSQYRWNPYLNQWVLK
jgi:hypothetical protein